MRSSPLRESLPDHAVIPHGGAHVASWPTFLIVDSDTAMLQTLVWFFEKRGYHVAAATSLAEARAFFHRRKSWTLVLADYYLPDGTGFELCCWLRDQSESAPPFLMMSGNAQCVAHCVGVDVLAKPFPLQTLESRIRALLEAR